MNEQSAGAILILAGLALLWALWSDRSPFSGALGQATPATDSGLGAVPGVQPGPVRDIRQRALDLLSWLGPAAGQSAAVDAVRQVLAGIIAAGPAAALWGQGIVSALEAAQAAGKSPAQAAASVGGS